MKPIEGITVKHARILEKHIKQNLVNLLEPLGSTRYFVEVSPRGKGFVAKIWVEEAIFHQIASDPEKLKGISDAVSAVEAEFGGEILEELKPLL